MLSARHGAQTCAESVLKALIAVAALLGVAISPAGVIKPLPVAVGPAR